MVRSLAEFQICHFPWQILSLDPKVGMVVMAKT